MAARLSAGCRPGTPTPERRDKMRDFRELKVWQKAHQLALDVYRQTRNFPADER